MGFKATRTTSPTAPVIDLSSGDVIIGGGVAAAPTNGAELLNLVKNWVQSQPDLQGRGTTVEVTNSQVNVLIQEPVEPVEPVEPTPEEPVQAVRWVIKASFVYTTATSPAPDVGSIVRNTDNCTVAQVLPGVVGPEGWDGVPIIHTGTRYLAGPMLSFTGISSYAHSLDGVTWTVFSEPYEGGMTYGESQKCSGHGDTFILATYTRGIFRSTDLGQTWTKVRNFFLEDGGVGSAVQSLCYGGGYWVLGVWANTNTVWYSGDGGATWATVGVSAGNAGIPYDIIWAGNRFATVIYRGAAGTQFCYSEVGAPLSWTSVSLPSRANWSGISFVDTKYILLNAESFPTDYYRYEVDAATFAVSGGAQDAAVQRHNKFFFDGGNRLYNEGRNDACFRSDNEAYTAFVYVPWSSMGGTPITVTPEDITAANNGGGVVSFFWSAGLDPAYLKNPIAIAYPPTCEAGHTLATNRNITTFTGRNPSNRATYFVASFNGQFFDYGRMMWVDALTAGCKIPISFLVDGQFEAILVYIFAQRRYAAPPAATKAFFITAYDEGGYPKAISVAYAAMTIPAELQLRSGAQYINFVTGRLQNTPSAETCLYFDSWSNRSGDGTSWWYCLTADMPSYGPGLEPYVPPSTLSPVAIGGGGGDFVAGPDGYSSAPSSPFTFLAGGGFDATTAPPMSKRVAAGGFSACTAPPLPFSTGGGFLEAGSSLQLYTSATAVTQHMGLPFTTNKG